MASKRKGSVIKHSPNNSWFRNAVRSMGLAGSDLIKDMVPAMYETGAGLYNVSKEARAALKSASTKNLSKSIAGMIEQNQYTRMARNSLTNAISDLKTGKLYNKERMDKAMEADFGLEDFNLDDLMDGSDDVGFGDISDESIDVNINKTNVIAQDPEATRLLVETVDEGMRQAATATLTAAKAQTDTTIAVASNAIAAIQSTGDAIVRKLDSIDSNIANLVTYMNDNVTKFIEASSKYYETMSSAQSADTSPNSTNVEGNVSPFTDHGGFDFKNLIKFAQNNAIKVAQESTVGSMAQMLTLSPALIENGLIPALMKGGMKALVPKVLQNSLSNVEKTFQGFAETLLTRVADFSNANNPILAAFGKVFGYKEKSKANYDLTKFERGAIPFDGMTKHSIVEIIPRELRKIQEILTGKEAKIYDWTTGTYQSPGEIRKTNRQLVRQEGITAMENSEFGQKMRERTILLTEKDQEKFTKMLDTFYDNLTKFEGFFDPNDEKSITKMLPGMQQEFGEALSNFFIKAVQTAGESAHMSVNPAKNRGIRNRRQMMETMEANPYEYNLFATEMDDSSIPALNISGSQAAIASKTNTRTARGWLGRLRGTPQPAMASASAASATTVSTTPRVVSRSARFRGQRASRTRSTAGASSGSSDDGGPYLSSSVENYTADELERRMRQQDELSNFGSDIGGSRISGVFNAPAQKAASGLNSFGNILYKFAFGNGQDVMNELLDRFGKMLTGLADTLDKNILQPLKNSLVGTTDQDGFSRGGVFSNVINSSKDFMNSVWSKFNGKSYKTSTGETVEGDPSSSVVGQLKKGVQVVKEETMNFLFGKKNEESGKREGGNGFLAKARDSLRNGLNKWGELLFGKEIGENGEEIATEFTKQVKERAPKAFATGIAGAGVGMLNGLGTFGLLGSAILPGGPIGGAIVGTALGFFTQSEKFKNLVFGEKDDNGERTGGIISKKVQDFVKSNKTEIIGGAALGTMKSMIMGGSGILSSIVGGPMAGALMGTAFALIKKSDAFQTLLYGKGEPGDPDYKKGIVTAFKEKMQTKDGKNRFGIIGTGAAGGAMAATVVGNMGVIGAALTPAGPIGGALMGAGLGIAAASDKFRSLVFGELDEDTGKRQGGLVQKFQSYISNEIFTPAKLFLKGVALDAKEFISEKMVEPLRMAMDPVIEEFKYIGSRIKEKVSEVANRVVTGVKEIVIQPLGSALNKYLVDPLKKVGSTIFNAVFGVVKAVVGAPFKAIGAFANALVGRQTDRAVKAEDESIWNDPNRGFFTKIKDSFMLNASRSRQQSAAEAAYPWMQGRDERAAEREDARTVRKYADRYDYERERMQAFDQRYQARAKGYDLTSDAGLEALSRSDRKKVEKEQERRRKEGARIDKLNIARLRKGLPLLKNPYAGENIFYDIKEGKKQRDWLEKENEKREENGDEKLPNPFPEKKKKKKKKKEKAAEETSVKSTDESTTAASEESAVVSGSGASARDIMRASGFGGLQFFAAKKTSKSGSSDADESGEESTVSSSSETNASSSTSAKGSSKDLMLRYVKDIRDEVKGQLNGLGSNVNKIKRMLAKALGVKDPDKDGDNNKEYKSFADRFFDFMSRPLHNVVKLVTAPIRAVSDIVSSVKEKFTNALNTLKEIPGKIVGGFVSIFKGIGSSIGGLINGALSAGAKVLDSAIKGIGKAGEVLVNGFTGLVSGAARGIGSVISGVAEVGNALVTGAMTVVSNIPTLISSAAEAVGNIARVGLNIIGSAFKTAKTAIVETATLLKSAVVGAVGTLWRGIKGIASGIVGAAGSAAGWVSDKLGIQRKTKVRYAGEIQRITEPVTVITAEKKPIHVVIDKFDDEVDLGQTSINELRGYDEKGEFVDSIEDFFDMLKSSDSSGGGGFGSVLGSLFRPKKKKEDKSEEDSSVKDSESTQAAAPEGGSLMREMMRKGGLQFFAQPKKQYGRQFDADEAAEDKEDASVLKEKVEENTRKDASYMMGLLKQADAAAEEKEMRQRMVQGIENIDIEQKSHNSIWDSIFSKKGLITAGLIALAPIILKFLNKFMDFDLGDLLSRIGSSVGDVVNNAIFGMENTDTAKESAEQKKEYTDLVTGNSSVGEFILPEGEHDATSDSRLKMVTKPVERGIHFVKKGVAKAGAIKEKGLLRGLLSKTKYSDQMKAGETIVTGIKNTMKAAPGTIGEDIALRAMYAGDWLRSKGDDIALRAMYAGDWVQDKAGKLANTKVGQAVTSAASTVADKAGQIGQAVSTKASTVATKISTTASNVAGKAGEAVSNTLTSLSNTAVGKTVGNATKTIASTVTSAFDTFISFMEKKIPSVAGKLSSVIKPVAEKIIGDDSLLRKIAAKVSTKVASKGGLAAVTLGASEIVWAIIGAVDGATSASNMFVCEKDAVDWKMILISSAMKAALNTTIGTIFDIIDSILWATMGVSLVRSLAQIIYGVMSSQEEVDALAASQQVVQQDYLEQVNEEKQKAYEEYVKGLDDPSTALTFENWDAQYGDQVDVTSFADYNDERNKTMFHKVTDAVGGAVTKVKEGANAVWSGVKNVAGKVGSTVKNVASGAWNTVKGAAGAVASKVGEVASGAWNTVKSAGSAVAEKAGEIYDSVAPVVSDVARTFKNAGKKIATAIGEKVSDVTEPIREKFGEFKDNFVEGWTTVKEGASTLISNAGSAISSAAQTFWDNTEPIREAASTAVTKVKEGVGWVGEKVKEGADAIAETAGDIWNNLGEVWDKAKEDVGEFATSVKDNFKKGLDNLNNTFGTLFGFTNEDGESISFTDGIKGGIKNITTNIGNTISNVGIGLQNLWIKFSNWANDENEPLKEYVGNGRGRGRSRRPFTGYRALGWGRGSDVFNQLDARWNSADPTMRDNGCGPTVAAMMVRHYGRGGYNPFSSSNPAEANAMSYDLGMRDIDGGTDPKFFEAYGASKGVQMTEGVPNPGSIANSLSAGEPVALMGRGGVFGPGMHYLMADGISGNNVNLVDPYGGARKSSSISSLVQNSATAIYSRLSGGRGRPVFRFGRGTDAEKKPDSKVTIFGSAIQRESELDAPPDYYATGKGRRYSRWGRGGEMKNGMVYYNQADPSWSSHTTGGSSTLGKSGCVISSLAMCVSQIAGQSITPPMIVEKYNYTLSGGGMIWGNMTKVAAEFGGEMTAVNSKESIIQALSEGKPVMIYGEKPSCPVVDYTDNGSRSGPHCVVIAAISSDKKTIKINDPGKRERCDKTYSVDTIKNFQCAYAASKGGKGVSGSNVTFGAATVSGSSGTSETASSSASGTDFFSKLSSGMTEIGNRLWEGAISGNYNTDFSTFFTSGTFDSSSSSSSSGGNVSVSGGQYIGDYVKKYESGDAGSAMISSGSGDYGGVSFGTYQFPSNKSASSNLWNFWNKYYAANNPGITIGNNQAFKDAWLKEVNANPEQFRKNEWEFVFQNYYRTARDDLKKRYGFDVDSKSRAWQEAIWSSAVQYGPGPGGILSGRYRAAFGNADSDSMDPTQWIQKFYQAKRDGVNSNFSSSSASVKNSVRNRYTNEENDLKAIANMAPVKYTDGGQTYGGISGTVAGTGRFGRGRGHRVPVFAFARGRGSNPNLAYLEHAYRKAAFGRGVDDAYSTYAMQQAILSYLQVIATNTGSTVDAINGIEIPQSSGGVLVQGGNTTNNNVSVKPAKTSGNSQSTQKINRNEAIARAIARGVT